MVVGHGRPRPWCFPHNRNVHSSQTKRSYLNDPARVSLKYHYRRMLPHHQWKGKIYFITFCTYDRYQLTPGSRDIVLETCHAGNGKLFHLHAIVVMPDHVHLVISPISNEAGEVPLPKIMQAIKGASAHRINEYLGRKGRLWRTSHSTAARSTENLRGKIEYIMGNPVRAGLVQDPAEYRWLWTESRAGTPAPHNLFEKPNA
jgi:putative transposase